jgi:hypothetical protein
MIGALLNQSNSAWLSTEHAIVPFWEMGANARNTTSLTVQGEIHLRLCAKDRRGSPPRLGHRLEGTSP